MGTLLFNVAGYAAVVLCAKQGMDEDDNRGSLRQLKAPCRSYTSARFRQLLIICCGWHHRDFSVEYQSSAMLLQVSRLVQIAMHRSPTPQHEHAV
jgi:hypothetical protein